MSPDEIVYHYPSNTLADVYAALAYYHDNMDEIREYIADEEAFVNKIKAKTPSLVQQKLKHLRDHKNSLLYTEEELEIK